MKNISQELDNYYTAHSDQIELSETKSEKYASFNTDLGKLQEYIIESRDTRNELIEDCTKFSDFLDSYKSFIGIFNDFPIKIENTFYYWSVVAERLNKLKEPDIDLNGEIINTHFKIIDLNSKIIDSNFIHFEQTDNSKCLLIFSLDANFENFLLNEIQSAHVDILFIWLDQFDFINSYSATQYVLLCLEDAIELKDLKPILKLQVLLNGKEIKSLEKYNHPPFAPHFRSFNFSEKYVQFESIASVLNEYNNQKYLLDKYLKLYHIIENFMYKHKVCTLQREKAGSSLHIRDFQTLYDRFSSNENNCIQEFFIEVMKLDYNGNKIIEIIKSEWSNLEVIDATNSSKIDVLLSSLGLSKNYKYEPLKSNIDGNMFAIMVYKIRNSIVHNKDSELHLESTNLPSSAKFLIEKFFIPNLEKIVFHLIINRNDIVWYENNLLQLYEV